MICTQCSNVIDEKSLFCQYCGAKIERNFEEETLIQAKGVRRVPNIDFIRARAIYNVWLHQLYFPKYANLEEYGKYEVGLKKAHVYNYRIIGEKFIDDNNNLRFIGCGYWTIGQVNELKRLTLEQVNSLIAENVIHTNMTCKQLRESINIHFPSNYIR